MGNQSQDPSTQKQQGAADNTGQSQDRNRQDQTGGNRGQDPSRDKQQDRQAKDAGQVPSSDDDIDDGDETIQPGQAPDTDRSGSTRPRNT